ncbi:MAG TPA: sigma-70 family RNA polymerase sigma factor, partial [Verrucomicrobiae bacterium]|nr:sigma-70 family RNA polymerase sigma factor [Verrucomicrobiae bacterium]
MTDDAELLRAYVQEGSEPAFRQLVERHIPTVLAAARRIVANDLHLAQDVTQTVFTDLARQAGSLPPGVILGGWLHRHTCYTALKAIRTENRRRTRERTAMEINALNESSAGDAQWAQLAPVLDDALSQLGAEDRDAIVLRYLQQQDVRSIGLALGASENAAQKRLGRALDKLRAVLTRRGVTLSTALLSTALDAGAATAPVSSSLAATVSATALHSAAANATASVLTLASLKTMTTTKLALSVTAIVLLAGATTLIVQRNDSAPEPASPMPIAQSAAPAPAPVKVVNTAKVEAPKAAPAPAGGAALPEIEPANNPSSGPNSFTVNSSGADVSPGSPFNSTPPRRAVGGTVSFNTAGTPNQVTLNAAGTRLSSVAMANGQMVISTTNPDGTVDTQTIPVVTTAGGKQAVISFSDANGTRQVMVVPTETDPQGASATVVGHGTLTIMDNANGGPSTGAMVILSNGPASDSSTSTSN